MFVKYIKDTIVKSITDYVEGKEGTYRIILPSYPAELLLAVGVELEEQFKRFLNRRIRFEYGVAYRLGEQWLESGTTSDKKSFSAIQDRGWYNEGNNLTSLRNTLKDPTDDCLVILLAGYDHIDDRASLQDFFHLDQEALWRNCLRQSFQTWVVEALQEDINPDDSELQITKISDLFNALYDYGLADLLKISKYLEEMNFSEAMTGTDAYKLILTNLAPFLLPCMVGLARKSTKKRFSNYIVSAQGFLNYNMFINESDRKKYKRNIEEYNSKGEELDDEILGGIESREALVKILEDYIDNCSLESKNRLQKADFVYIYDHILRLKSEKSNSSKKRPKRLAGFPPEVFLRALWETLGDLKSETQKDNLIISDSITKITLRSLEFKHDFDWEDEEEKSSGQAEIARSFLRKTLGGIDKYLESHIRLKLGSKYDSRDVIFQSNLFPDIDDDILSYKKTGTAEPLFKFKVTIDYSDYSDNKQFSREFCWSIPQNHQCRLLVDLYNLAQKGYLNAAYSNPLPVFSLPYMGEIFMARDEEEVNRLIGTALRRKECSMIDLLMVAKEDEKEEVKSLAINNLSREYQKFLREFEGKGFFCALDKCYDPLRQAYTFTFEKFLENSTDSTLGPLLLKAFMVVPGQTKNDVVSWIWQEYLEAAVLTPLHPSVLEMIHHQHTYLCDSFCFNINKALAESSVSAFSLKRWDLVADLSKIQWPIFGILKNENKVLETNMRSFNYFHIIGENPEETSFVTSRLLLKYDDLEDEEITDKELFRETQSSNLIKNVLQDYRNLYAFANDGISIGSFCGKDIQPVIAGIDSFLKDLLNDLEGRYYSLRLTIFSDSRDDSSIISWVNAWQDIWQTAELSSGKQHYKNCQISVAYRVVSRQDNIEDFKKLLQSSSLDIMIFSDFIEAATSHFVTLDQNSTQFEDYSKFPVLEKTCCKESGGGKEKKRQRILSNPRFKLGSLHGEVMAYLKKGYLEPNKRNLVVSQSDYKPWSDLVDIAHKSSAWVVCIDPSIDEQQLRSQDSEAYNREIIGFGTGVGSHGENNFTISTEKFTMGDIEHKISNQVSSLLGPWDKEECNQIANHLIRYATNISGLSLVKATGPVRYVRELIASAMVRKLLPKDEEFFCDDIISLDAFLHWFTDSIPTKRPDLLRLRAEIKDGVFHIDAQVIECKLAQEGEGYLEKARQQIESGLRQLIPSFKPREGKNPIGIDDTFKPDQRYWWMQLHRLIASRGQTNKNKYSEALQALELLSEGHFCIYWQGAVVAFWTDNDSSIMITEPRWDFSFEGQNLIISVATAGKEFIRDVCLNDASGEIFSNEKKITFESVIKTPLKDNNRGQEIETDSIDSVQEEKELTGTALNYKRSIPERILLGGGTAGGRDIYWEFGHPELPNRHILVFGASGTGKTYTIQALMFELSKLNQNSLIVDYTNGFTNTQLEDIVIEHLNPKQHIISTEPLAVNPFRKQINYIDDIALPDDPANIAQRVSGVFSEVYQLGDQQKSALYLAVREGIIQYGDNLNLNKLIRLLEDIREKGGPTSNSAASVISKIQPFVDMNPFGKEEPESWEKIFQDPISRCHIIQLAGFMKDASRLITEFSLIDLYWFYRTKGSKDDPKVIVLDEIQNLDHRLESPLGQFLTEGRKFGISLILATQTLSNLSKDEKDRLFQASHKLFFKPADTEINNFATIISHATGTKPDEWFTKLSSLKLGECYSLGPALNTATGKLINQCFRTKIKSLKERL